MSADKKPKKRGFSSFSYKISLSFFLIFLLNLHAEEDGLPNFLIIGAQKSGTGFLYEILRQHPLIIDRPGEIHFFDIFYSEGVEWYKAQFPTNKQGTIRGDKSPYYLFHPLVPERAHALVPNAKIIILLRNPIDRAYSQFWMSVRNHRENLSFYEALLEENARVSPDLKMILSTGITPQFSSHRYHSYLARGCYAEQIKRWLAYYPRDQILIICFEELSQNPKNEISKILSFLDLPEYEGFDFKVGKKHRYPEMTSYLRKNLSRFFKPHNEELEELLNRKFNWD